VRFGCFLPEGQTSPVDNSRAFFFSSAVSGRPPPGTDLNSPLHKWFDNQHSVTGAWCCSISDGHILKSKDWRVSGDHYEVWIGGQWRKIKQKMLVNPAGGPNPTGHAIVWYNLYPEGDVQIYCFLPGTGT